MYPVLILLHIGYACMVFWDPRWDLGVLWTSCQWLFEEKVKLFLSSEWMIETTKVKVERVLKCGCWQCVSLLLWWAFILLTFLLVYLYQCNVSEYAVWSDHKLSDLWISWWIQMYINRMAGSLCKDQRVVVIFFLTIF